VMSAQNEMIVKLECALHNCPKDELGGRSYL
jgi:hypothetical protein